MSLKSFHILFIFSAVGLLAFTGWWSVSMLRAGQNHEAMGLAICSFIGLAALLFYVPWFLRKAKQLH